MKKTLLSVGLAFSLFANSQSTEDNTNWVHSVFENQKEIYIQFEASSNEQVNKLSSIISVDGYDENSKIATAYCNEKQFANFLNTGIEYLVLQKPSTLVEANMWDFSVADASPCNGVWDAYPTYSAYVDLMYQFEAAYPDICDVFSIGTTYEGKELIVAKISDNLTTDEDEPEFLYTSTMHGDETAGYPLMIRLIDHLLCNYGSNTEVTNLVNNIEIYINPLANPDGAYSQSDNSVNGATRSNSNGIDLNRNYPDPETGIHPDGESYQLETQHFMDFAAEHNFDVAANLHGGAEVVNYPWDTWGVDHADVDWWEHVSTEFAENAQNNSPNGYFNYMGDGVTNGYDWYEVDGGRQDYMNYELRCREFTLEMSDDKTPSGNDLPDLWDYNKQAFLDYMQQSLYGIRGIVTDSITGEPLEAHIFIVDHDVNNSDVYSHLPVGNYHRPIYQGSYTIVASADGYNSKTIENVSVTNNQETRLDIQLGSLNSVGTDELENPEMSVFPNPGNDIIQLLFNKINSRDLSFDIYDMTGKLIYHEDIKNQKDFIIRKMNISHFNSGIYTLVLSSDNNVQQIRFIKE